MLITDMTPFQLRELADELEEKDRLSKIPKPLAAPDFSEVIKSTEKMMENLSMGMGVDGDDTQYLYNEVMQAVYGVKIFQWINKQRNY